MTYFHDLQNYIELCDINACILIITIIISTGLLLFDEYLLNSGLPRKACVIIKKAKQLRGQQSSE